MHSPRARWTVRVWRGVAWRACHTKHMFAFFHLPGPATTHGHVARPPPAPTLPPGHARTAPVTCERAAAPGPPSGATLACPRTRRALRPPDESDVHPRPVSGASNRRDQEPMVTLAACTLHPPPAPRSPHYPTSPHGAGRRVILSTLPRNRNRSRRAHHAPIRSHHRVSEHPNLIPCILCISVSRLP